MVKAHQGVAVEDPAFRDIDTEAWRPGRFEERIRRCWNTVTTQEIRGCKGDLECLTDRIHARVGGDRGEIRHVLERFQAAEQNPQSKPVRDQLIRPGAPP